MTSSEALQDVLAHATGVRAAGAPYGLAVVELTMRPGEMTPLHVHEEYEVVRVLEGTLVVHIAGEARTLAAGDAFVIPVGEPHAVSGEEGARFLTMSQVRSVESYERFVRAAAVPETGSSDHPPVVEEERSLALMAEANGITVLGPPGTLSARPPVAA